MMHVWYVVHIRVPSTPFSAGTDNSSIICSAKFDSDNYSSINILPEI